MTIFNARVDGARAEDGKVIFDVDVDGQKSAPWTYKEFPEGGDLWGLNIHTSGEERDRIATAISAYARANGEAKRAAFELARSQTIPLSADSRCLRCAGTAIQVVAKSPTNCGECGATYALAQAPRMAQSVGRRSKSAGVDGHTATRSTAKPSAPE